MDNDRRRKTAKAYFVLGLQLGDPMDKVIRRHKRLIIVWHPDRFPNEDGKKDAEEELKQINNAKDDLKNHFEKNHKAGGSCACSPAPGASSQQSGRGTDQGQASEKLPRRPTAKRQKRSEGAGSASEKQQRRQQKRKGKNSRS